MNNNYSWQKVRFEQICKNVSKRIDEPEYSGFDKFVGLEHLDTLEPKITRWGSTNDIKSSMTLFKESQILFGRRNWYLRRVAVANFDGVCSGDIYVLEPIEGKIIKEFLPILMHSDEFFEKNMMYSHGSMSTRVKWSNLAKLEFFIPQIQEQKTMCSLIYQIDDTISNTQNLLEKTKMYFTSKRESLITKGIEHKKFQKVKWLFGKYEEIPEGWGFKKLGELTKITDGSHYSPKKISNGFPMATVENVKGNMIDINSCHHISKMDFDQLVKNGDQPEIGDILFTKDGTIGKTLVYRQNEKIVLLSSIAIIRKSEKIDSDYCNYVLRSKFMIKHLAKYFGGTAIKRIILQHISKFEFPIPPLQEQQKIVVILSKLDNQITHLENYLAILKSMRRSIINSKLKLKDNTNDIN